MSQESAFWRPPAALAMLNQGTPTLTATLRSVLPQAEYIALRVLEVGKRAHAGDRGTRRKGNAATVLDLLQGIGNSLDVDSGY